MTMTSERLLVLLFLCLGATEAAQAQTPFKATRVLDRESRLLNSDPARPIAALPLLLSMADAAEADRLRGPFTLHSKRPTEAGPPIPGLIRHGFGSAAGYPLWVVEDDLLSLPDPAFMSAMVYLRLLQGHARKHGPPGVIARGAAAVAASNLTYRSRWAWSLSAREEAAVWYLLKAL